MLRQQLFVLVAGVLLEGSRAIINASAVAKTFRTVCSRDAAPEPPAMGLRRVQNVFATARRHSISAKVVH